MTGVEFGGYLTGMTQDLIAGDFGSLPSAIASALSISGTILGVGIAWKLFKRFTK